MKRLRHGERGRETLQFVLSRMTSRHCTGGAAMRVEHAMVKLPAVPAPCDGVGIGGKESVAAVFGGISVSGVV
jgi:hypothetical protein